MKYSEFYTNLRPIVVNVYWFERKGNISKRRWQAEVLPIGKCRPGKCRPSKKEESAIVLILGREGTRWRIGFFGKACIKRKRDSFNWNGRWTAVRRSTVRLALWAETFGDASDADHYCSSSEVKGATQLRGVFFMELRRNHVLIQGHSVHYRLQNYSQNHRFERRGWSGFDCKEQEKLRNWQKQQSTTKLREQEEARTRRSSK